jgi:hypothetical protein
MAYSRLGKLEMAPASSSASSAAAAAAAAGVQSYGGYLLLHQLEFHQLEFHQLELHHLIHEMAYL